MTTGVSSAAPAPAEAADERADRTGDGPSFGLRLPLWPVELVFRRVPPLVAGRLRTAALRACGVRIGKTSGFWGMPTFVAQTRSGGGRSLSRLRVGEYCGFNQGCFFELDDRILIGDHVSVGHDVMFLTRTAEPGTPSRRAGKARCAPVVIDNGVWLGARSTVMPGVTIGAGAVIGASVVVTTDVPPNTLVMGAQKISLAKWR